MKKERKRKREHAAACRYCFVVTGCGVFLLVMCDDDDVTGM